MRKTCKCGKEATQCVQLTIHKLKVTIPRTRIVIPIPYRNDFQVLYMCDDHMHPITKLLEKESKNDILLSTEKVRWQL